MAFEKTMLAVAEDCGLEGAYFAYGTMFVPVEGVTDETLARFKGELAYNKIQVCTAGDEVAIDFV